MRQTGIVPDVEILPTIAGLQNGRDEVLEAALESNLTGISSDLILPETCQLEQNYPNPFNSETRIEYRIDNPSFVTLSVYSVQGRIIDRLVKKDQESGDYRVSWDGREVNGEIVASGIYFCVLKIRSENDVYEVKRKMILVR